MGQEYRRAIGGRFDGIGLRLGQQLLPWIIVAGVANVRHHGHRRGAGGIERANKVMMPVLFFLFAGLGIYIAYAARRAGATATRYIFTLDPEGLADPMALDLRLRSGVLLPLRRGQRHRHLRLLSAQGRRA